VAERCDRRTLPLTRVRAQAVSWSPGIPPAKPISASQAKVTMTQTVLLVEDDLQALEAMQAYLRRRGYRVVAVASADAVPLIDQGPDVLVTDWQLGEGPSGIDVARELRRRQPDLPVILVTAYPFDAVKNECFAVGVAAFLGKPLRLAKLADVIDAVTGNL